MHIFFSGIGGTGIGPLALVAQQSGYSVSGSDKQASQYIDYLAKHGITDVTIGQSATNIAAAHSKNPIDWYVYSSAVAIEQPNHPEFAFCQANNIRMSKRDELLNEIITQKQLNLIAVAGTHGKTTTTALLVWALQQLNVPAGYILPAKSSFADMGACEPDAKYFVYECDEFDRNFLHFRPHLSLVTGIDWDHPDIFPTREAYYQAFREFIAQSDYNVLWQSDVNRLNRNPGEKDRVLSDTDEKMKLITLAGEVNRRNAWQVAQSINLLFAIPLDKSIAVLNTFPGVSRRFEQITLGLYSDYAHTTEKIRGALQIGQEIAGDNLVVVYEGLHNTRQHFIRDDLTHLFDAVKQLYIVPSYLAREDPSLELLTPPKLKAGLSEASQSKTTASALSNELRLAIQQHLAAGNTVLCLSAGGGGSLDEWLRQNFAS
ncbi:MAG TPA: Mur ligase domain-containing protein [Candidatus Saccharibacteria bacterium]|jgi:UDP-N-acetylmuramate--alanine ligase|nr:Mur ligase domain-containing protein [Candidatus Saccharibacteria bacterium]